MRPRLAVTAPLLGAALSCSLTGCGTSSETRDPTSTTICDYGVPSRDRLVLTIEHQTYIPPDNYNDQIEGPVLFSDSNKDNCLTGENIKPQIESKGDVIGEITTSNGSCIKAVAVYNEGDAQSNPDKECQIAVLQEQLDTYAERWSQEMPSVKIYEP